MRLVANEAFAAPDGSGRGYGGLLPPDLVQMVASGAPVPHAPPVGFDVANACVCLGRCVGGRRPGCVVDGWVGGGEVIYIEREGGPSHLSLTSTRTCAHKTKTG